jgi:hypothetical protein
VADLILACSRNGRPAIAAERLRGAALRLAPPEVPLREPRMIGAAGVVAAVANPTDEGVVLPRGLGDDAGEPGGPPGGAVCLGGLFGDPGAWWRIGAEAPEGTYALARWDADAVELLSDVCASRTLWYALTEDAFVASTSQRALVMLLGGFELLPEATACFLSSGTLGPEVSWDARLRRLPPDARGVLDRTSWRIALHDASIAPGATAGDAGADLATLRDAITATCGSLDLDLERWVLPLSGGHDSRTLLAFLLANGLRPRCVTWTTHASLRDPLSDASVARHLARRLGVEHELLFLDRGDADADATLTRFVAADEGRNDEIAGYLDGFASWRDLVQAGVCGVIRGDEAMGGRWRPTNVVSARLGCGGATPADYPDDHVLGRLRLADQRWPARLSMTPAERLMDYELRLEQTAYIPSVLAGLTGAKARYLEVVNPLLSRRILDTVHSLPKHLRDRAQAFTRIVDGVDRWIPYARFSSTPSTQDFLASAAFFETAVRELTAPAMERVLPGDGALQVLTALTLPAPDPVGPRARLRASVKHASSALPTRVWYRLRPGWTGPESLPPAQLALRAVLAGRTIALFESDARAIRGESTG